jgi:hypothetical protein
VDCEKYQVHDFVNIAIFFFFLVPSLTNG